jgi:hypothetical protein
MNPRAKQLFVDPDQAFDYRKFKLVDAGEKDLATLCEAPSLSRLFAEFAERSAKDLRTTVASAAKQILSGQDHANAWTCTDATLLRFLRELGDPALTVAAFLLLFYLRPRFGKVASSPYFAEVEERYPGYVYLLEFASPQTAEAFCVMGLGAVATGRISSQARPAPSGRGAPAKTRRRSPDRRS